MAGHLNIGGKTEDRDKKYQVLPSVIQLPASIQGGEIVDKKPQRLEKEAEVNRLLELLKNSETVVLTDYRGLTVAQDVLLRRQLREAGVKYHVAKNSLIKLACHAIEQQALDPYLTGPTAVAFAQDPVTVAKLLTNFIKEVKKTEIKAGLLGKKLISAAEVDALAKLPPREILLAQTVGVFQAPLAGFAGVTSGLLRQLVTVTDRIREQKAAIGA
jgi:large subunit ribosomal protein L10